MIGLVGAVGKGLKTPNKFENGDDPLSLAQGVKPESAREKERVVLRKSMWVGVEAREENGRWEIWVFMRSMDWDEWYSISIDIKPRKEHGLLVSGTGISFLSEWGDEVRVWFNKALGEKLFYNESGVNEH